MTKQTKQRVAALTALVLATVMLPVQATDTAAAASKKFTISKKAGSYSETVQTTVQAKAGYKVYYTKNGSFTTAKVIQSGKSKTFTIKKDTALQVIAVKKSAKVTKKKLNGKWQSKVKTYVYRIDSETGGNPQATSGTDNGATTTPGQSDPVVTNVPVSSGTPTATSKPSASATPAATQKPGVSAAPTASASAGGNSGNNNTPGGGGSSTSNTVTGLTAITADTTRPAALTYDASTATSITMTNSGSGSGTGYKMETETSSGETVLTIKSAGTYIVSTNGAVKGRIEVKKGLGDVTIVLNGVNLTSSVAGDGGVIECKGKDDDSGTSNNLKVILAAGTTNTLTATGVGETETEADGTTDTDYPSGILVKKTSKLTLGGTGTLNITSTNGSGIKVKFNECSTSGDIDTNCATLSAFWDTTLIIQDNPTLTITCNSADEAAYSQNNHNTDNYDAHQDAISSKNSLAIYGGTITLAAGDDGIHAEAQSHIAGGTITVTSSTEALEGARVAIDGGTLNLTAYDDGINAANGDLTTNTQTGEDVSIFNITINGGSVTVNSEGDGIDSNGNAFITGGTVTVYGPSSGGNGALDVADRTGSLVVSGGALTATAGTSDMAITPSTTGLGFVAFTSNTAISANTTLKITDSSGNTVGTLSTKKTTKWVLYCGSGITNGSTYNLVNGSTTVATATAGQGSAGGMGGGMAPPSGGSAPGDMGGGMTPPSGGSAPGDMGGGMTPPSGGNPPGV